MYQLQGLDLFDIDLKELLAAHQYKLIQEFNSGGSEAQSALAQHPAYGEVLVKTSNWEGIGGNGIPWLIAQQKRLKFLRETLPSPVASYFPKVFASHHNKENGYFLFSLEYFPEMAPCITFDIFKDPAEGLETLSSAIDFLATHLYKPSLSLHNTDSFIEDAHLNRLKYRTDLLVNKSGPIYKKCIEPNSFKLGNLSFLNLSDFFIRLHEQHELSINGKSYPSLPTISKILHDYSSLLNHRYSPQKLPALFHGDLLLRNILIAPSKYKFIDIRGDNIHSKTPSLISIDYEMGKISHSLLMDFIREDFFSLDIAPSNEYFHFTLTFPSNDQSKKILSFWQHFHEFLMNIPSLHHLAQEEAHFEEAILLSAGMHFATDAINRMTQDPSGSHTVGFYLLAILLLSDFMDRVPELRKFGRPFQPEMLLKMPI